MKDFEERKTFLARILIIRGYEKGLSKKQFCKALERYVGEFQKWALPIRFDIWFRDIRSVAFYDFPSKIMRLHCLTLFT